MRKSIENKNNFIDKMNEIKHNCSGKDFVVFGCGPSFNERTKEEMSSFCKDKVVVCIKQSYFRYRDICDIHFYNDNNLVEYEHGEDILTVSSSRLPYSKAKNQIWRNQRESDFHFEIQGYSFDETIASTNNFEINNISKCFNKTRWGPGIILECVFPFLSYISPDNIYVLGWDYESPDIKGGFHMKHFYPNENRDYFTRPAEKCWPEENALLVRNSKFLNDYFLKRNINLFVLSESSHVSSEIRRVKI